jgi:hypothetical protein
LVLLGFVGGSGLDGVHDGDEMGWFGER